MDFERHIELDQRIVAAAKDIKVLSWLTWSPDKMADFLARWHRGAPKLPEIEYPPGDVLDEPMRAFSAAEDGLAALDDPVGRYLLDTARSYRVLCQLLQAAGTGAMAGHSRELYGAPGDVLSEGSVNNLQAARHFLKHSEQFYRATHLHEADYCIPAAIVKEDLEKGLGEVFPEGTVKVVVDPNLASKAAAGATRIRLRDETCFSEYDIEQLLQHEAFVHSLTALNGRAQPNITCLSLGAPRTTGPQEGLATFAEIVTAAIDIDRLERIALRVIAIDMALEGADFIEVFRYFLDAGQPETESFNSAMRVFRGAPVTGGAAFTKDVVYLHGLLEVHTFFRWALHNQRMHLCRNFLAGRMTITDAIRLAPMFEDGLLAGPTYLPPWMTRTNGLAGYLAFSIFASKISVDAIDEHHRFERVDELSA